MKLSKGKTNLQIPISEKLKNKAAKVAEEQGFSSLQEAVRLLIKNFADGQLVLSFHLPEERLSYEKIKQYERDLEELENDIKAGRAKSFDNVEDLIKSLHE